MAPLRLFTAGTHNGLIFNNESIDKIYTQSISTSPEKIPFVLGHPKNDLPVVGYLPKTALKKFSENQSESIGFERGDAEFSEESLEALRKLGSNKISVRLKDGVISHIGLVEKPAIAANAEQDFQVLSGEYDFGEVLFSDDKQSLWDDFVQLFKKEKSKKTTDMNNETTSSHVEELEALRVENAALKAKQAEQAVAQAAAAKAERIANFEQRIADFGLSDEQKTQAKAIAEVLASATLDFEDNVKKTSHTAVAEFASLLGELSKRQQVLQGSVTTDFAKKNQEVKNGDEALQREIEQEFKNLQ